MHLYVYDCVIHWDVHVGYSGARCCADNFGRLPWNRYTLTVLALPQLIHFEILKRNLNYRNGAYLTTNISPSLRKMEQNLQINSYTRHFSVHIFQYIESFPTVEDYSTSRHDSPCRLCALKLYWVSYYTALQNVQKSSVYLNGPPQRSQVCNFFIFTAAEM